VILIGYKHINNYLPLFNRTVLNAPGNENPIELKILSYNVRAFNLYDWLNDPNTNKGIFNFIRSEHPDVICLQEFYTSKESDFHPDKVSKLFGETPFQHIHYSFSSGKNTGYGIATFSK
jgi:exonuclease III